MIAAACGIGGTKWQIGSARRPFSVVRRSQRSEQTRKVVAMSERRPMRRKRSEPIIASADHVRLDGRNRVDSVYASTQSLGQFGQIGPNSRPELPERPLPGGAAAVRLPGLYGRRWRYAVIIPLMGRQEQTMNSEQKWSS